MVQKAAIQKYIFFQSNAGFYDIDDMYMSIVYMYICISSTGFLLCLCECLQDYLGMRRVYIAGSYFGWVEIDLHVMSLSSATVV